VGTTTPAVSVCIPTFNSERYLSKALTSIAAQGFGDYEVIAVDDCSSDGTWEILNAVEDSRYRIFRNPRNLGRVKNTNRTLRLARGTFVKILHPDDWLDPHCLARMKEAADQFESGLVFCERNVETEDSDSARTKDWLKWAGSLTNTAEFIKPGFLEGRALVGHLLAEPGSRNRIGEPSTVMFRREVLRESGYFNERLWQADDSDLWLRILWFTNAVFVPEPLTTFLFRAGSETSVNTDNPEKSRNWLDRLWMVTGWKELASLWATHPELEKRLASEERRALRLLKSRRDRESLRQLLTYVQHRTLGGQSLIFPGDRVPRRTISPPATR